MNFRPLFQTVSAILFLSVLVPAADLSAYEVPSFRGAPFDRDGLFLSDSDRETLLEALAAIGCNFPGSKVVDSDLIEKALGIALVIDPFHRNARQAHEALIEGKNPEATAYFDSLSSVSEALWAGAVTLSTPPAEPEALNLAPLLMELSLLTHPAPPEARLLAFDELIKKRKVNWTGFVAIQEDSNNSSLRAQHLKKEARTLLKESIAATPAVEMPVPEPPAMVEPAPAVTIREESRRLTGVFPTAASRIAGEIVIQIRAPSATPEIARFPFLNQLKVEDYPMLPIMAERGKYRLSGFDFPVETAKGLGITWQQGSMAEVSLVEGSPGADSERTGPVNVALPLILGLKSISASKPLNPAFGILGEIAAPDSAAPTIPDPAGSLSAARDLGVPYLLIPAEGLPPLLETLSQSEELELLFFSDLLAYQTVEEAFELLTIAEASPAMLEATAIFDEIESVSSRMPLPELARNLKVQERLESILTLVPNHFSARAMLDFGKAPISAVALTGQAISRIDEVINPYFALKNPSFAEVNNLSNGLEESAIALAPLRTDLPEEAKNYFVLADDMLAAAEVYLGLTNKTTSLGIQRHRELLELLDKLDAERSQLGLGPRAALN